MKRINKLQLVLLVSAMMITLPLLMVPASSVPTAEVEKENHLYYFKIHAHSTSYTSDKQVEYIYKNLTPDPQDVYITISPLKPEKFIDNLVSEFAFGDIYGEPGTFVYFTVDVKEPYHPHTQLASFSGTIKLPPVN